MSERRMGRAPKPSPDAVTYVIIGNGISGVTAAEVLRQEDAAANIIVIADDPFPVYYRPALKDYLAGRVREDKLWARPTSFYQDHSIHFVKDRVMAIQTSQHRLQLAGGRTGDYSRLLIASGARPATLRCPGTNLEGVTTLRTVADYQAVLQRLPHVKRVAVVGSGTLALETVETLRHRGLTVSHLIRKSTLWSEVLDQTASDLVLQQERRAGVDVHVGEEVAEIYGSNGQVKGLITTSDTEIPCELVLIAIGVEPAVDFLQGSGIQCGRGINVDSRMQTNVPDIYAAGDVLETTDKVTRRTRVIGQWYPAIQQARAAAYSMLDLLDNQRPFNSSTFYNATFLYGLDFASVGLTNVTGLQEVVAEPKPRTYRKALLKDGIPLGMLALGDRRQVLAFKRAIDHRVNLRSVAQRLFNDDFQLNQWLDEQGIPAARLGVKREGDTAVKQAAYPTGNPSATGALALTKQTPVEARLVPLNNTPQLDLSELRLSQTQVLTVGRQAGVHLLIDEGTVSRRHAELRFANGQYVLHDLGSSNGTFVNNERIPAQSAFVLTSGDELRFGKVVKFAFTTVAVSSQKKRESAGPMTMAGVSPLLTQNALKPGQPELNPDGSLLLPEATSAIPAAVVQRFQEQPGLIVLMGDAAQASQRPPLVYLLRPGKQIRLGRDKENDIDLADIVVSRRHAEIFPGPDGYYIRDLQSSNGVVVNQAKIDNPYRLSHGDRIIIGSSSIYFIDLHVSQDSETVTSAPVEIPTEPISLGKKVEKPAQQSAEITQVVLCQRCGTANTRVARFCAGCSALLVADRVQQTERKRS